MSGMRQTRSRLWVSPIMLSIIFGAIACALALSLVPITSNVETTASQSPTTVTISRNQAQATMQTSAKRDGFASWNADSFSLAELKAFVADVCDPASPNCVAPAERLATFDMDGTIISEKAPVYCGHMLLIHRILDDATFRADAETRALALQMRANADHGIMVPSLTESKNAAYGRVFQGMTSGEFGAYVSDFFTNTPVEGFSNMTYGESFYRPMVEVIDYLQANDFDVYVVSACAREVVRAVAGPHLGIDPSHIVGSDLAITATGQGDAADNAHTLEPGDVVALKDDALSDYSNFNKVVHIQREIGKRPILAFGNSSGDSSMLNYAEAIPTHRGMGVLVVADDGIREYGSAMKARGMYDKAAQYRWTTFSMAGDWATIYGPHVARTCLIADIIDAAA